MSVTEDVWVSLKMRGSDTGDAVKISDTQILVDLDVLSMYQ